MVTELSHKSLRVLLVEDMQSDADLLVRHLTRAGFAVGHRRVDNAQAMRQALAEGTWDLILCDYKMPGFDAPAALQICQECGLDIPFIVVSGTIGEETAVAMMKAGVHDYLLKGNLSRLVVAIERELREAVTRREHRQAVEAQARRQQEMAAINQVMAVTTSTLDLQQVLDTLLDNLRALSGADRASVMLLDQKTDLLISAAARGSDGPLPATLRLASGQGAAGQVIENAKPLIRYPPPEPLDRPHQLRWGFDLTAALQRLIEPSRLFGLYSRAVA
jgi:DNA-binding response OmpR family regulator